MVLGRPREFDVDIALDKAMDLFWTQGYESTSLHNLLSATGLSKSSLYKVFGSKKELFEKSIDRYSIKLHTSMAKGLATKASGWAFIEDILRFIIHEKERAAAPRGCLLINSINEWSVHNQEIQQRVIDRFYTFENLFEQAIIRAQKEGAIPQESNSKDLAAFLVCSISGLRSSVKAKSSSEKLDTLVQFILSSLKARKQTGPIGPNI
ncbi:TetR/AcrR family transcriptional regulator [Kiloniella antarctica]|uniref:TetR/AcrR family transcriptional regulator n=1 Tax=Kiloniella antarctica TaxID=1550907 RepID=A0ABW5BLQ5_9PROT